MFDTVAQYGEALKNDVDDWHPPIMVRLWQLLHPFGPAATPMFAVQVGLYATGFALIIASLATSGRWRASLAVVALAVSPLLLGWQMVVLKDTQMLGALIAAFGIVAHFRLSGRRVPVVASVGVGILVAYATLVRANSVFATIPLVALILPRPKPLARRAGVALVVLGAVLALTPVINHRLLGATSSGVAKTLPIFDLAAIAVAAPAAPSPFTPAERSQIATRHCVKNFFWDPLGDPTACGPVTERLKSQSESDLYAELARAAAAHPIAYVMHRIRHWNSTQRWLVPSDLFGAAPPIEAEPNHLGLETPPNAFASSWQDAAAIEAATPLGWPVTWTFLGLFLLPRALKQQSEPAGGLALALLVSSLTLEASFLVVSIASDLRYHLWSMAAVPLALILLASKSWFSRTVLIALVAGLLVVTIGGLLARYGLPRAPGTYEGMIQAPSG